MSDELKAQIARARRAGVEGLVCRTCDGMRCAVLDFKHITTTVDCPACDGTGDPSAAEVLMFWVLRGYRVVAPDGGDDRRVAAETMKDALDAMGVAS